MSDKITFYRIEKNGSGPYQCGEARHWNYPDENHHRCTIKRSTIPNDSKEFEASWDRLKDRYSYLFAFRTMTQLKTWFTERDRRLLAERKFNVITVQVPTEYAVVGRTQAVYHEKYATILDRQPIETTLKDK